MKINTKLFVKKDFDTEHSKQILHLINNFPSVALWSQCIYSPIDMEKFFLEGYSFQKQKFIFSFVYKRQCIGFVNIDVASIEAHSTAIVNVCLDNKFCDNALIEKLIKLIIFTTKHFLDLSISLLLFNVISKHQDFLIDPIKASGFEFTSKITLQFAATGKKIAANQYKKLI